MRRLLILSTVFLLGSLSPALSQDVGSQLKTYFQQADSTSQKMRAIAEEMNQSLDGVNEALKAGTFDSEAMRVKFLGFEKRMTETRAAFEAATVPEQAQHHHSFVLDQYSTAILVLRKTGPLLNTTDKISEVAARAKDENEDQEVLKTEMAALEAKVGKLRQEVEKLAAAGQRFGREAKRERAALVKQYKLES